jgi:hypothetical protein
MLKQKSLLDYVLKEYQTLDGRAGGPPNFMLLLDMLTKIEASINTEFYNEGTCFEFHQLLVATILGYGNMLEVFARAMYELNESMVEDRELSAKHFWQFSCLLWWIAYSKMLAQHLAMLEEGSFLHLPSDHEKEDYMSYASFASPLVPKTAGKKGLGAGEDKGSEGAGEEGVSEEIENDMDNKLRYAQMDLIKQKDKK